MILQSRTIYATSNLPPLNTRPNRTLSTSKPHRTLPTVFVIMGVSGCGKTSVGQAIGKAMDWPFYDADAYHPPSNITKMVNGIPLTDEDRWPWLDTLSHIIQGHVGEGTRAVLACSALKPEYRQRLRGNSSSPDAVGFILLEPTREELLERLLRRVEIGTHFMPVSLLDTQLETLQYEGSELWMRFGSTWPRKATKVIVRKMRHYVKKEDKLKQHET